VGLYRTHAPLPGHEAEIPGGVLVFIGEGPTSGARFVVRPRHNRQNRWYWEPPTIAIAPGSLAWAHALVSLPSEGFYTLPEERHWPGGGVWRENAIVQLGYNEHGQGIVFVGESRADAPDNALYFSERGMLIDDGLLRRLRWAPILPVSAAVAAVPAGSMTN
jgi:hypothetical protein